MLLLLCFLPPLETRAFLFFLLFFFFFFALIFRCSFSSAHLSGNPREYRASTGQMHALLIFFFKKKNFSFSLSLKKKNKNPSSPLLADIIAALQHACAATLPPHARPTAALALCKIAARSDEPYCGSAFSFLAALLGNSGNAKALSPPRDPLGLAPSVAECVAALDEVYSSRVALQRLVKARLSEVAAEKRKEKEKEKDEDEEGEDERSKRRRR